MASVLVSMGKIQKNLFFQYYLYYDGALQKMHSKLLKIKIGVDTKIYSFPW